MKLERAFFGLLCASSLLLSCFSSRGALSAREEGVCESQIVEAVWNLYTARVSRALVDSKRSRSVDLVDLGRAIDRLSRVSEHWPPEGPSYFGYQPSESLRETLRQWNQWYGRNKSCLRFSEERGLLERDKACDAGSKRPSVSSVRQGNEKCDQSIVRAIWSLDAAIVGRAVEDWTAGRDRQEFDLKAWEPGDEVRPVDLEAALLSLARITGMDPSPPGHLGYEANELLPETLRKYQDWFDKNGMSLRFNEDKGKLERKSDSSLK
jgi:hypothetical protein